ncbi:uncharacterized protein BDZ99DRAFT_462324 [Mytilinidion resinicola]|uniref:Uncharacterized protein n=1 Tax=Mytilinidion resinicola TaxID=574789 RepID=A0A6A6YT07_9PEZI|nr:uncharacterized protein BDZ99DRAFT_462324 [Mytilinidion resinicola]KAF2811047.1 hypothetical protein BDZ99DRAFT_462324 [Mytilinidion resinicola]
MTVPDVLSVWKVIDERKQYFPGLRSNAIWVETGNTKAGYEHILRHQDEFKLLGIGPHELAEVAEAVTTVATHVGAQKKTAKRPGRPVFLVIYKDKPIAVAIDVGVTASWWE